MSKPKQDIEKVWPILQTREPGYCRRYDDVGSLDILLDCKGHDLSQMMEKRQGCCQKLQKDKWVLCKEVQNRDLIGNIGDSVGMELLNALQVQRIRGCTEVLKNQSKRTKYIQLKPSWSWKYFCYGIEIDYDCYLVSMDNYGDIQKIGKLLGI